MWSILNGRLRKRNPLLAKQRALGAVLMLASSLSSLRLMLMQLTLVFWKFYKSRGSYVLHGLFYSTAMCFTPKYGSWLEPLTCKCLRFQIFG